MNYRVFLGLGLFIAVVLPPAAAQLEANLVWHVLLQLPMLVLAGWLVARGLPARLLTAINRYNEYGIPGILIVTFVGLCWMIPRVLDAALQLPMVALAKYVSIPLLVGAPLALSWPRMHAIARGLRLDRAARYAAAFGLALSGVAHSPVHQLHPQRSDCSGQAIADNRSHDSGVLGGQAFFTTANAETVGRVGYICRSPTIAHRRFFGLTRIDQRGPTSGAIHFGCPFGFVTSRTQRPGFYAGLSAPGGPLPRSISYKSPPRRVYQNHVAAIQVT